MFNVGLASHVVVSLELVVSFYAHSQRVLFVYLPVKAEVVVQSLSVPVVASVYVLTDVFYASVGFQNGRFGKIDVANAFPLPVVKQSEEFDVVVAIVKVGSCRRVAVTEDEVLVVARSEVESEAVALSAHRLYSYNCRNCGIILRSRIGNYLNALYLFRAQTLQLVLILHLSAVDVEDRLALAKHLQLVVFHRHSRNLRKHL